MMEDFDSYQDLLFRGLPSRLDLEHALGNFLNDYLGLIVLFIPIMTFLIMMFWIIANMARNRNRSPIGWCIYSIFFSPILAILVLLLVGRRHINHPRNPNAFKPHINDNGYRPRKSIRYR